MSTQKIGNTLSDDHLLYLSNRTIADMDHVDTRRQVQCLVRAVHLPLTLLRPVDAERPDQADRLKRINNHLARLSGVDRDALRGDRLGAGRLLAPQEVTAMTAAVHRQAKAIPLQTLALVGLGIIEAERRYEPIQAG